MAEIRNSEGYIDLTAYEAHKKIEREERNSTSMSILKGDIYYIEKYQTSGSEQRGNRPAIVVSNNKCNEVSGVIEVVYLTTQPKTDLPTHVTIRSTGRTSIALCEQITPISIDRIGNYIATVTDDEMMNIDIALMVSLGISAPKAKTVTKEVVKEVVKEVPVGGEELDALKAEVELREREIRELKAIVSQRECAIESLKKDLDTANGLVIRYGEKYRLMREIYNETISSPVVMNMSSSDLTVKRGVQGV